MSRHADAAGLPSRLLKGTELGRLRPLSAVRGAHQLLRNLVPHFPQAADERQMDPSAFMQRCWIPDGAELGMSLAHRSLPHSMLYVGQITLQCSVGRVEVLPITCMSESF